MMIERFGVGDWLTGLLFASFRSQLVAQRADRSSTIAVPDGSAIRSRLKPVAVSVRCFLGPVTVTFGRATRPAAVHAILANEERQYSISGRTKTAPSSRASKTLVQRRIDVQASTLRTTARSAGPPRPVASSALY